MTAGQHECTRPSLVIFMYMYVHVHIIFSSSYKTSSLDLRPTPALPGYLLSLSLSISTSISSLPQTQTPLPYPRRQIRTYPHSAGAPCIWPASQSTRATGTLLSFSTSPFSFILPSPFSFTTTITITSHLSFPRSPFPLRLYVHTTPNPCLNRRVKSESRFPLSLA